MKLLIVGLATLVLLLQCKTVEENVQTVVVEEVESENLKSIEGHWKFSTAEKVRDTPFLQNYPNQITPAWETTTMESPYNGPDLIFENDTLHEISYPVHRRSYAKYSQTNGYLYYHHQWHTDSVPFQKKGDTILIYRPFYDDVYIKETFIKTHFDDKVISILKMHGSNYPELAGIWKLVQASSGNDGTEYELDFYHTLPDTLTISQEEFTLGVENNYTHQILTDGVKKEYTFLYKWGMLWLTPGAWYEGDDPRIHFERVEKENR